jgi:hypothetical protein
MHGQRNIKTFCVVLIINTYIFTSSFSPHVPEVFPVDWQMMVQTVVTIKIYWHFGVCEREADRQTDKERKDTSCFCAAIM